MTLSRAIERALDPSPISLGMVKILTLSVPKQEVAVRFDQNTMSGLKPITDLSSDTKLCSVTLGF